MSCTCSFRRTQSCPERSLKHYNYIDRTIASKCSCKHTSVLEWLNWEESVSQTAGKLSREVSGQTQWSFWCCCTTLASSSTRTRLHRRRGTIMAEIWFQKSPWETPLWQSWPKQSALYHHIHLPRFAWCSQRIGITKTKVVSAFFWQKQRTISPEGVPCHWKVP